MIYMSGSLAPGGRPDGSVAVGSDFVFGFGLVCAWRWVCAESEILGAVRGWVRVPAFLTRAASWPHPPLTTC